MIKMALLQDSRQDYLSAKTNKNIDITPEMKPHRHFNHHIRNGVL